MRLLTATARTQGEHPDDEFTCTEGELVRPAMCDHDPCPICDRRFAGISTNGVTTTAMLADLDLTRAQLLDIVKGYADEEWHWHDADFDALADDLLWPGEQGWPVGTVLERDCCDLTVRTAGTS